MSADPDIAAIVATAVTAIRTAARSVGMEGSGIDERQIKELRQAIDELELRLNEKKRVLDADQA